MAGPSNLARKSFFVDAKALAQARRLLRASTDAEAVRLALAHVTEAERFARYLEQTRGKLPRGSFDPV